MIYVLTEINVGRHHLSVGVGSRWEAFRLRRWRYGWDLYVGFLDAGYWLGPAYDEEAQP